MLTILTPNLMPSLPNWKTIVVNKSSFGRLLHYFISRLRLPQTGGTLYLRKDATMKQAMTIRMCSDLKAHFADEPLLVQQRETLNHYNTDQSVASEFNAEAKEPKEEAKVLVHAA